MPPRTEPSAQALSGLPRPEPVRWVCVESRAASATRRRHGYLPKLGREFAQFSFLSGRASRRQKVRLQGRPGTGEMTREKRNRDFKRRSRWKGRASVTAVSRELAPQTVCKHLVSSD